MGELAAKIWEDLEFDIVKEAWNTYYLEDGVRIRGRTILKKLMRRKQGQNTSSPPTSKTSLSR